jgi:hypothetical protein
MDVVNMGEGVQGSEGDERVPEVVAPVPGLRRKGIGGIQGYEAVIEGADEGLEVIGGARRPQVGQGQRGAAPAYLPKVELAMPSAAEGEAGCSVLPEELTEINWDVNSPDVGYVSSRVQVDTEDVLDPNVPQELELLEFGGEHWGGELGYDALGKGSQRLVIKDGTRVDPVDRGHQVSQMQGRRGREEALLSKGIDGVIHVIVGMGTGP